MYCEKCGAQIDDDFVFCQKCGTKHSVITECSKKELQSDIKKTRNIKLKIAFIIVFIAFIATTGILCVRTQGLKNNIFITLEACIFPFAVGIGFNLLGNAFRNRNGMQRFLHIFGSVFHCLCPVILMFVCYYSFHIARTGAIILAFSLAFLGYIPAHYNKNYSLMKNNILGVINLFSIIFMWSFISYYIGVANALTYAQKVFQYSFEFTVLLFKAGIILMLLQALKLIAEEFED